MGVKLGYSSTGVEYVAVIATDILQNKCRNDNLREFVVCDYYLHFVEETTISC
jgi:hypothetical protein